MRRGLRDGRRWVGLISVTLSENVPPTDMAQASPQIWEGSLELSGNYLYGNSDRAIPSARSALCATTVSDTCCDSIRAS